MSAPAASAAGAAEVTSGAAEVDVYVNGDLLLDDFAFRAATPYIDVPAGVVLEIGVAPGTSTGPGDIIATFPVTLAVNETYAVIANGVLDPDQFAPNPDGRSIGFTIPMWASSRIACSGQNTLVRSNNPKA